jgi:hypothetical protein
MLRISPTRPIPSEGWLSIAVTDSKLKNLVRWEPGGARLNSRNPCEDLGLQLPDPIILNVADPRVQQHCMSILVWPCMQAVDTHSRLCVYKMASPRSKSSSLYSHTRISTGSKFTVKKPNSASWLLY